MGAITLITKEAAKDLFKYFCRNYIRLDKAVEFGHERYQYIDKIMLEEEGDEVREWWKKLDRNPTYKSLLRRMIWERFLRLLTKHIDSIEERRS